MMLFWTTLIFNVLLIVWTVPALSAVLTNSDNYVTTRNNNNNTETKSAFVKAPEGNDTSGVNSTTKGNVNMSESKSFYNEELNEEGRKKKQDMMSRILPMMIIPFMLQTAIIPMMLTMLKMMLIKSAFIGKMAILLGFINMFRGQTNQGGVYTHNIQLGHEQPHDHLMAEHYGYKGDEEYGAYVNRKKRNNR